MRRSRGFVLINALVLVAALSAVALALLARAEGSRIRVLAAGQAVQLELYLDAYEVLAQSLLNRDIGAMDHEGEAWARDDNDLSLDRGRVAGQITDLQGRFNLNWLTNPEDVVVRNAFEALVARLGVSTRVRDEIIAALGPGGGDSEARRDQGVPEDLPGGAALMLDQLPIPDDALERLDPYVTVLAGGGKLNVNTVTAPVLASFLPGASPAALDTLLRTRATEPFTSVEDFKNRLIDAVGAELVENLDEDRFGIGSEWFEVTITAALDGQIARRDVVLQRLPLPVGAQVAYRLDTW
ncbi:type II secretion system minor pseudopilin GspK [Roseovarius sp. 2305UL8-3]|uniref:type II secretion system minor pseudopilin GspK n=1 Tax=Roseovarius conchicola TaxID=3121636 RepID=UPI003526CC32